MPVSKTNSLTELLKVLKYFSYKTQNKITFEYLLLKDFNDKTSDAIELVSLCSQVPCKVNLIEYNSIDNSKFIKSNESETRVFKEYLESKNITVQQRKSRGNDINAACGQLANKKEVL